MYTEQIQDENKAQGSRKHVWISQKAFKSPQTPQWPFMLLHASSEEREILSRHNTLTQILNYRRGNSALARAAVGPDRQHLEGARFKRHKWAWSRARSSRRACTPNRKQAFHWSSTLQNSILERRLSVTFVRALGVLKPRHTCCHDNQPERCGKLGIMNVTCHSFSLAVQFKSVFLHYTFQQQSNTHQILDFLPPAQLISNVGKKQKHHSITGAASWLTHWPSTCRLPFHTQQPYCSLCSSGCAVAPSRSSPPQRNP